jgi:anaerobic magnesium-protoporphyrin IX monomethyl ester cyclase
MANVLLLYPVVSETETVFFPYSLLFLQSQLENDGHSVEIIDLQTGYTAYENYIKHLKEKPDFLGISLFCGPGIKLAVNAAKACRHLSPGTVIVWGGVLPSLAPEMILNDAAADFIVRFDGEKTFSKLIEEIIKGNLFPDIPNIAWKKYNKITLTDQGNLLNLKEILPLNFNKVINEKYIMKNKLLGKRTATIFSSKGCPYSCSFCYNTVYNRGAWRSFTTDWVINTIESIIKNFSVDSFLILDDDFFVDRNRAVDIFKRTLSLGYKIKWWAEIRVDQILSMSIEELNEFYKLGLRVLYIAPESGSNRILRILKKGFSVNDIIKVNEILSNTGIHPVYSFMMGVPSETEEELLKTIDLINLLRDANKNACILQINNYLPYPGTPLYETALHYGLKPFEKINDWSGTVNTMPVINPWSVLSKSKIQTIACLSVFLKSNEYISNHSAIYKFIVKIYRSIFTFRMEHHIFSPFLDTWSMLLFLRFSFLFGNIRLKKVLGKSNEDKSEKIF